MAYTITGVDPAHFTHLFGLDDAELARSNAVRRRIKEGETYPERIELRETRVGEDVLLVNYTHQSAATPYQASHAIFIAEGAKVPAVYHDTVPPALAKRMISLRAFDGSHFLAGAEVVAGHDLEARILDFLARPEVAYLHAHYAGPGCFAAKIERG